MQLYECDNCKAINRISGLHLAKQPICGSCGKEISDFFLSVAIRKIWHYKFIVIFLLFCAIISIVNSIDISIKTNYPLKITQQKPMVENQPTELSPPASPRQILQKDAVLTVADNRPRVAPLSIKTPLAGGGFYFRIQIKGRKNHI